MRVLGVVWVGTRTAAFEETVAFFRDVLGVPMEELGPDFAEGRMPDSSLVEVFGPSDEDHLHFSTGPVPEFLVDDLPAALAELRAAGVEVLGQPEVRGTEGWLHFRAPDGNVYGLTAGSSYVRPATG
ncbi:MAG TPA: VOC family protein [Candidatus Limnocylindria bacterium]|jgi:catechol 2,3-dioxygenase-like lactoylglutathione lyase family enzyme|nr:VOC family protein [Candidatus Limnocylindria bacterium]